MTDLADLVDPLKRTVAVPGTFATVYKTTSESDLIGSLMDAFAMAQLDGFFGTQTLNLDAETVTPDLSAAGRAVVITYAAEAIIQAQIMSMKTRVAYEAGPVKYATEQSANVLTEILKSLKARRVTLQDSMASYQRVGTFSMQDMYADRVSGIEDVFIGSPTFYPYELAG